MGGQGCAPGVNGNPIAALFSQVCAGITIPGTPRARGTAVWLPSLTVGLKAVCDVVLMFGLAAAAQLVDSTRKSEALPGGGRLPDVRITPQNRARVAARAGVTLRHVFPGVRPTRRGASCPCARARQHTSCVFYTAVTLLRRALT